MAIFVKDKTFYKTFFTLTFTIAAQNILAVGVNLTDNIMLGRYAQDALSGAAIANQIQFFLQMIILGIGEGIVVMSSREWGRGQPQTIRRLACIGLWLGVIISGILFIVVFSFPNECLSLFSRDEGVILEGAKYLRIICFSYALLALTSILNAVLRSVETVITGFIISSSTLVINFFLNYMLIYGNFGAPSLGVRGSAIATLIARIVEVIIMGIYVLWIDKKIRLKLSDFLKIHLGLFKSYLAIGSPVVISNAIWGIAMAVQTAILGHMGSAAIAANSVATTMFQCLSFVAYASASASAVMIGKTIGQGRVDLVRQYAKTMQFLFIGIGICTGAALFACKDILISFYDISAEAKTLTVQFITILSVTVVGTAYQMPALVGIVRSGGDTGFVLKNDMIFMWFLVLPLSTVAAFVLRLSPALVFFCLKSDQILKCFVAVVKLNRFRWIREWTS